MLLWALDMCLGWYQHIAMQSMLKVTCNGIELAGRGSSDVRYWRQPMTPPNWSMLCQARDCDENQEQWDEIMRPDLNRWKGGLLGDGSWMSTHDQMHKSRMLTAADGERQFRESRQLDRYACPASPPDDDD